MSKKDLLKFSKTLLDKPINLTRKRIVRNNKLALEPLPEPLKPTKYIAQKPVPKPRKKHQFLYQGQLDLNPSIEG